MRRLILAWALGGLLAADFALAQQTFPYKAYVAADDVYVRSGPGDDYYPTDKLPAGTVVEVYRHDPGGWYAIKPPEGSFAWVSRRYLKPAGDALAEVTGTRVAARVGSRFSTIRDVVQVRLDEGELVELIEPDQCALPGGESSDHWVKVAPPSGEFRWIHGRHVDVNYPASGIRRAPAEESPLYQAALPERRARQAARREAARRSSTEADLVAVPAEALPRRSFGAQDGSFERRVEAVEVELATMMAEEPTVWTFDRLRPEAESLLDEATTAVERGRVQVLLGKLDRLADIRQRRDSIDTLLASRQRLDERLARLDASAREPEGRFDGRGRLARVVSPKPGAPRYALVDTSGKVQCYVTPAPGVNLRHYEDRWVGVNGTRGYVLEQQAPHIMAQHVSVLGDPTLR